MNAAKLYDIVSRALSVIQESDGADEHAELLGELRTLVSDVAECDRCSGEVHFEDGNPLPSEQLPPTRSGLEAGRFRLIGWTKGDGTGHVGYNVFDFFDADGQFIGADPHGIEPIFEVQS